MSTDVAVFQEQPERRFNPNEHIMQIPNKGGKQDYLPVQWRLVWFRELCPQGTIETEMVLLDLDRETEEETYVWNQETRRSEKTIKRANGIAVFKAVVTDGKGGKAEAYKSEKAASFGDFIEKANTGAVGRALAMLGYGTQFAQEELDEEHRIVDAPVDRKPTRSYQERKPFVESTVAVKEEPAQDAPATDQQINSIRKLLQHLGKTEEIREDLRYLEAKAMITELSHQYNERKMNQHKPQAEVVDAAPASNGHAEPSAKLPTVKELQARCNELCGSGAWQTMVHKATKIPVSDGPVLDKDMTIDYRQKISAYLDFVEQQKASVTAGT